MKNSTKKLTAFFLTFAMLISVFCISAGALSVTDMTDYSKEHWAAEALGWAVDNGLIKGYTDNTIRPDDYLTRAEMATVINRLFAAGILYDVSKFEDVNVNDWFYQEIAKAYNMGTFEGSDDTHVLPNNNIVREEAFVVIARALVLNGTDAKILDKKFGDASNVSSWATGLLADMAEREYVNGSPVDGQEKNNVYPRSYITRAEFAQVLCNIFDVINSNAEVKNLEVEGNLLLNNTDKELNVSNVTVSGDLIIADGVEFNTVTLKDVEIGGRLVIRGGKSVKLTNVTTGKGVVVRNNNTTVNFQNYEDEKVFEGIIAKTPITFLSKDGNKPSGSISITGGGYTNVPYYVDYYIQDRNGSYKQDGNRVAYNGRDGGTINISAIDKDKEGYTYDHYTYTLAGSSNEVMGTGKSFEISNGLVVKLYYNLNTYKVTFDFNYEGANPATKEETFKHGDQIVFPNHDRDGYGLLGWFTTPQDGGEEIKAGYTVKSETTLYARWGLGNASYTVNVYLQDTDGEYAQTYTYTYTDSVPHNSQVTIQHADIIGNLNPEDKELVETHFAFDDNASENEGTVAAGADNVFSIYYTRNKYTVTFEDPQVWANPVVKTVDVYYQGTLDEDQFAWVEEDGYNVTYIGENFTSTIKNNKWLLSTDLDTELTAATLITGNITVWPQWNTLKVGGYLESRDFTQSLSVEYNDDKRAIETFKDFIFKNKSIVAINEVIEAYDNAVGKLSFILDADKNIKLIEQEICIVETLKPENVEQMIEDAFAGTTMTDKQKEEMTNFVDGLLGVDADGDGTVSADEKQVVITEDNVEIVEKYADQIDNVEFEDIKEHIPDIYTQTMSEAEMQKAFTDATTQYKDEIYEALYNFYNEHPELVVPPYLQEWYEQKYAGTASLMSVPMAQNENYTIRSYVKIKIDPIDGVLMPKYDQAMDKLNNYEDKYDDNQYFMRLLEILDPNVLLADNGLGEETNAALGLSGYKLLTLEEYYAYLQEAVIMADEAGKQFKADLTDEQIEELGDKFSEIMTEYMATINEYLDEYAVKAINNIVDKVERLERLKEYEDRRLTADDIAKIEDYLNKAVKGYDITTTDAYEKAYNFDDDTFDGLKFTSDNIPTDKIDATNTVDGFYKEYKGNETWLVRGTYTSTDD